MTYKSCFKLEPTALNVMAIIFLVYGLAQVIVRHRPQDGLWAIIIAAALGIGLALRPMYARFEENRRKEAAAPEKYRLLH